MPNPSQMYKLVLQIRVIHSLVPGLEHVAEVLVQVGELGQLLGVEVLLHAEVALLGRGQVQGAAVPQGDLGRRARDRLDKRHGQDQR